MPDHSPKMGAACRTTRPILIVLPPFVQLKSLLDDFAGHNIDAACALVEAAGRFFYRWAAAAAQPRRHAVSASMRATCAGAGAGSRHGT